MQLPWLDNEASRFIQLYHQLTQEESIPSRLKEVPLREILLSALYQYKQDMQKCRLLLETLNRLAIVDPEGQEFKEAIEFEKEVIFDEILKLKFTYFKCVKYAILKSTDENPVDILHSLGSISGKWSLLCKKALK